uniref:Calcium load-activated calcium channel n=1 Tax=Catharus ustulatus TaxID=91951 RepID=A0A8C3TRC8_CATUS
VQAPRPGKVQGGQTAPHTMFADTLLIVFISVCTALLAEGITWVLVYRTDKYKRLKAEVEKQSKKRKQHTTTGAKIELVLPYKYLIMVSVLLNA